MVVTFPMIATVGADVTVIHCGNATAMVVIFFIVVTFFMTVTVGTVVTVIYCVIIVTIVSFAITTPSIGTCYSCSSSYS